MVDENPRGGPGVPGMSDAPGLPDTPDAPGVHEVHERVRALLGVVGGPPGGDGDRVYALVEADDPGAPIVLRPGGPGCGGGRRVVLGGRGLAHVDVGRGRVTHLLVRCVTDDGDSAAVLVERGTRGIPDWPGDSRGEVEVEFVSARLDADAVVSGHPYA